MKPGADALEIVVEDEPAPAPPRPPLTRRLRPRAHWVVGAAAVAVGLSAAYVGLAITATAAIDREWRRTEALSQSYGLRVAEAKSDPGGLPYVVDRDEQFLGARLAGAADTYRTEAQRAVARIDRLIAVDPGVRSLRRLVAKRIRERAQRFIEAAVDDEPYLDDQGTGEVEAALTSQLRRWRLEPTVAARPELPALRSVPLFPRPLGARLALSSGETVIEVDSDGGEVRAHAEADQHWVARGGWVAVTVADTAYAVVPGEDNRRRLGTAQYVAGGSDPETVWLARRVEGRRFEAVEVDRFGTERSRVAGPGFLHWVTSTHVVSEVAHQPDYYSSQLVITPRSNEGQPRTVVDAWHLDAEGDVIAWAEHRWQGRTASETVRVHILDLASGGVRHVSVPGAMAGDVALSPDGSTVAVTWHDNREGRPFLTVHDLGTATEATRIAAPEEASFGDVAWSPDGRRLFVIVQDSERYPHAGRIAVIEKGSVVIEYLRVLGPFLFLLAAF